MNPITSPARDRANTRMAALVEAALAVHLEHGPRAAARFLSAGGVGFATTVRVLAEPERRRPADREPRG